MAKVAKNLILYGASGMVGDQIVIRQRGGRIILAQAPGERTTEPSEAQKEHQERFQQAIIYGKAQMADAAAKVEYQEKASGLRSAFNVAVADFPSTGSGQASTPRMWMRSMLRNITALRAIPSV